jgi:oxygen-dependent protoporphyrinogen oxidase
MSETQLAKEVVIVGAGISGLAAAFELQERAKAAGVPLKLTILESRPRIGGAIWTEEIDGFLCEGGADSFITNKPWAVDLCHKLGLSDELMETDTTNRRSFVLRKGKLMPVPEGFVLMAPNRAWPVLATPILSWKAKLRLMLEPFIPRRQPGGEDESLASFVKRRLGSEVLERLVQPLVGGIYTANPNELSLRSTMPQFIEMEAKHGSLLRASLWPRKEKKSIDKSASGARYGLFLTLKGGMGRLLDKLAEVLPAGSIRLDSPVRRLCHDETGQKWKLELLSGESIIADGVILAAEAHASARLVDELDTTLARHLRSIPYASSAIALVGFDKSQISHPLNGFGMVVPASENRRVLAISFTSVKLPSRAPAGKVLLRVFVGGAMQPELYDLPDEEIKKIVLEETADMLGTSGPPSLYRLARHGRAMPQYTLGHQDRVRQIEEQLAHHHGLVIASNALSGVGVPDCVRTARLAVQKLASQLKIN